MTIRKRKTLPQTSEDTLFDEGINSDGDLSLSPAGSQAEDRSVSSSEIQAVAEQIEQDAVDENLEKKVVVRSRGRKKNRSPFG